MISLIKKTSFGNAEVLMSFDSVCEWYTVDVFLSNCGGKFFTRDYRAKGSATRAYNSWVAKLSAIFNKEVSNVK